MKTGREIDLASAFDPAQAVQLLLRIRFAEVLERQGALAAGNDEEIHAFRLACKRLRYAIERSKDELPGLQPAAELLSELTDELGAAHDCVVLAQRAEKLGAPRITTRAKRDRSGYMNRARRLWARAFRNGSPFQLLAAHTGYSWKAA